MLRLLSIIGIFASISIILVWLMLLAKSAKKSSQKAMFSDIYRKSPYRNPHYSKSDEFLMRERKTEKLAQEGRDISGHQFVKVKRISSSGREYDTPSSISETRIVGIAEPKGFWSRFILGQKLGYIMARLGAVNKKGDGFWVNLINAQDIGRGRGEGRGR